MACETHLDPRVRKTREALRQSLASLLPEKGFDSLAVQDLAERADLNRATFYDHYADKFALLEDLVRVQFHTALAARGFHLEGVCPEAMRALATAVYEFRKSLAVGCPENQRQFEPFVERVLKEEIRLVLLRGIEKHAAHSAHEALVSRNPEMVAAAMAWALYGTVSDALERSRAVTDEPAFADAAASLLMQLLTAA